MNEYNIFLRLSIEFLLHQLQSHLQFNLIRITLYNRENIQENTNEYWNVAVFVVIVVIILSSGLSYAFDEIRKKRKAFFSFVLIFISAVNCIISKLMQILLQSFGCGQS